MVSRAGNNLASALPVACRAACVRHRNHVYLPRLNLVDDAVGKSLQHGKAMIVIVARKQLWTGLDQSKEVFHFCLKPGGCLRAARLIPGKSGIVFRLGLWVEEDVSHRPSPAPDVSPRPTARL